MGYAEEGEEAVTAWEYAGAKIAFTTGNAEYDRKTCVAKDLADEAYLRGGIVEMHTELKWLYRHEADPVIIAEFERLYHRQIIKADSDATL